VKQTNCQVSVGSEAVSELVSRGNNSKEDSRLSTSQSRGRFVQTLHYPHTHCSVKAKVAPLRWHTLDKSGTIQIKSNEIQ